MGPAFFKEPFLKSVLKTFLQQFINFINYKDSFQCVSIWVG